MGQQFKEVDVAEAFEELTEADGGPQRIRVDNGPEFISKQVDLWAYSRGVKLDFSRPRKPTDNPLIESFNSRFEQECLNLDWFLSMKDARLKIHDWRRDYNHLRPHSSLRAHLTQKIAKWKRKANSSLGLEAQQSQGGHSTSLRPMRDTLLGQSAACLRWQDFA